MIKKLITSFALATIIIVTFLFHDPWFKQKIETLFKTNFGTIFDINMTGTVTKIGLFPPHVVMHNVRVTPNDKSNWYWSAKRYTTSFSIKDILLYGLLSLRLDLEDFKAYSAIDNNTLAIAPHIAKIAGSAPFSVAICLQGITLTNAQFHAHDMKKNINGFLQWHQEMKLVDHMFRARIDVLDGSYTHHNTKIISQLCGNTVVHLPPPAYPKTSNIYKTYSWHMPLLPEESQTFYGTGQWHGLHGQLSIKNSDRSYVIDPIQLKTNSSFDQITALAKTTANLALLTPVLKPFIPLPQIHGQGTSTLNVSLKPKKTNISGKFTITNLGCNQTKLCTSVAGTVSCNNNKWQSDTTIQTAHTQLNATTQYNTLDQTGHATITNTHPITIPTSTKWRVTPEDFRIDGQYKNEKLTGTYFCNAQNPLDKQTITQKGLFRCSHQTLKTTGTINSFKYQIKAGLSPKPQLHLVECTDADDNIVLNLTRCHNKTNQFSAHVDVNTMAQWLPSSFDTERNAHGTVQAQIKYTDKIKAHVAMNNGTIRLPKTHNCINKFSTHIIFDPNKHCVTVPSFNLGLNRGSVTGKNFILKYDETLYKPLYIYAPLVFNHCWLNIDKDFFALISGQVLCHLKPNSLPFVDATLILERTQLTQNLFSRALQQTVRRATNSIAQHNVPSIACAISINTAEPIVIQTAFLQTSAHCSLNIENTINDPKLSGLIELESGTLHFPYKPLYITQGHLQFFPEQPYNPLIHLTAKNSINKYNVTLDVNGSLQNPHVTLNASPPISQEQAVSLLLVGSAEESLNVVVPALITQNLTHLIFANNQTQSFLQRTFGNLILPFERVHFIPNFSDQTGRGGLRGIVEIDVNERMRALIKRNFNLSEDTRVELEYLLSDDVAVRAIRDERRDIGGEVEIRWKF